ncbi:MAG: type II toxin-antitoxin system HicB family antitoxin [Candidatus Gracilibacteria bacterium]|nr:type II toxin-antitoxin system HicB family antitoxin [Candidatus Gracilibacteria bacterium]
MRKKNKTLYFPININKEEDGSYWGGGKIFEGCFSDGNNLEELGNNMVYAIKTYSDSIKEGFLMFQILEF